MQRRAAGKPKGLPGFTDARVQQRFGSLAHGEAIDLLMAADTAFASVNSVSNCST